jgi:hypothetical protein
VSIAHSRNPSPSPVTARSLSGIRVRVDAPPRHSVAFDIEAAFVVRSWYISVPLGSDPEVGEEGNIQPEHRSLTQKLPSLLHAEGVLQIPL